MFVENQPKPETLCGDTCLNIMLHLLCSDRSLRKPIILLRKSSEKQDQISRPSCWTTILSFQVLFPFLIKSSNLSLKRTTSETPAAGDLSAISVVTPASTDWTWPDISKQSMWTYPRFTAHTVENLTRTEIHSESTSKILTQTWSRHNCNSCLNWL